MKLGNLLIAGSAAVITFWAVTNKDRIIEEVEEITDLLDDISVSHSNIQEQAAIIKGYSQPLQEMSQDLNYKFRVFQQEAAGHLSQIQAIQEKYIPTENK